MRPHYYVLKRKGQNYCCIVRLTYRPESYDLMMKKYACAFGPYSTKGKAVEVAMYMNYEIDYPAILDGETDRIVTNHIP